MSVNDEMWVGRILATGAIVVYDVSLQVPDVSHIYVFSLSRVLVRQFDPSTLRAMVETVHGSDRNEALEKYKSWKEQHWSEFMQHEPLRLKEEALRLATAEQEEHRRVAAEKDRIRESHRQRMLELGIDPENAELRSVERRQNRVANCYACKRGLDNSIFIECTACAWIVCSCGACGCGYVP